MRVLFDVGANDGEQWFNELRNDQENTLVIMFEPSPDMVEKIKTKYKYLNNWVLVIACVSNFIGKATFNIGGSSGVSSLLEFRDDIKNTWPEYRVKGDLFVKEKITVDVITLDKFLLDNPNINKIDFLHIDTQGSDLNVLKGCEKHLNIIKEGQMEAAYNAPLYINSPNHTECIEWLENHNFVVKHVIGEGEECDIIFENKNNL